MCLLPTQGRGDIILNQKLVLSAIGLFVFFVFFKNFTPSTTVLYKAPSHKAKPVPAPKQPVLSTHKNLYNRHNIITKKPNLFKKLPLHSKERSLKQIKAFEKKTYLHIPDMDDFLLEDFSQDNVAVLSGKNFSRDTLTILATKEILNPEQISELILENPELFPFNTPNMFTAPLVPQPSISQNQKINGFSNVSAFTVEQHGWLTLILYAPREDSKGSYGIVLEGKKERIMSNYDYYGEKFLEMRALIK